jgi:hypothetical protein
MNFDQYEDPRPEQVELARAVTILLSVMIDKDGKPRDLADREGRKALQQAIDNFPREIPAKLNEADRRLLNESLPKAIEEMKKTQKTVKDWFWYIIGTMVLASAAISLCVVLLFR